MNELFEFTCDGDRMVARLFLPEGHPLAAVVTTGSPQGGLTLFVDDILDHDPPRRDRSPE